jgi:hypothetical protein
MRTQISLDDQQHARVKKKASELGITMAEYIRVLVDRDLGGENTQAPVSSIIGLGDSGGSDIANEPDASRNAVAARRRT